MIPKRFGTNPTVNDITASVPTGNGALPPIPSDAIPDNPISGSVNGSANPVARLVEPTVSNGTASQVVNVTPPKPQDDISAILMGLAKFAGANKKNIIDSKTFEILKNKKLISEYGDYAIVSEKGLMYLVDFNIFT